MKASKAKKYVATCFSSARGNMDDRQARKACDIAYDEGVAHTKTKAIRAYCTYCEMKKLIHCKPENPDCPFLEYFIKELK